MIKKKRRTEIVEDPLPNQKVYVKRGGGDRTKPNSDASSKDVLAIMSDSLTRTFNEIFSTTWGSDKVELEMNEASLITYRGIFELSIREADIYVPDCGNHI
jgi:hypothetical protein